MNDIPDVEITGEVTKFNLECGADGRAVLVAYTKDDEGRIGRVWIRFSPDGTVALRRYTDRMQVR